MYDADHNADRQPDRSADGSPIGRRCRPCDARRASRVDQGPSNNFGRRHKHTRHVPHPSTPDCSRRSRSRRTSRMDEISLHRFGLKTRAGRSTLFEIELGQETGEGWEY